ncbi:hypothetical protein [Moraxella ovis]|uniref:hypothetical protein n=1 Tax=Moraxella ovis TaxID=29433 RepID=UPI000AF5F21D|nr:hypothetical protein [Moraxella ovis]
MSAQIFANRRECYHILEQTQKGLALATEWLIWFLTNLEAALTQALAQSQKVVAKSQS